MKHMLSTSYVGAKFQGKYQVYVSVCMCMYICVGVCVCGYSLTFSRFYL